MNELKARPDLASIHSLYRKSYDRKNFNALVYGGLGTGKTTLFETCRKPIYIYSFDPDGMRSIEDAIDGVNIIADTRFEYDTLKNPKMYKLWEKEYMLRRRDGFFDMFATIGVDSLTTLGDLAMNEILRQQGRAGGVPFQQDYLPQMKALEYVIKDLLSLPCDVVLTAHVDTDKDEVSGKMMAYPMVTGKLKVKLPLLFSEIYCAVSKQTAKGTEYSLLTRNDGVFTARTRIGSKNKLEMYEQPNIKYILKKCGYDYTDKAQTIEAAATDAVIDTADDDTFDDVYHHEAESLEGGEEVQSVE